MIYKCNYLVDNMRLKVNNSGYLVDTQQDNFVHVN
jgi:hypothetical protein